MEIVVEGTGTKELLPDVVKIEIEFKFLEKTYDKSLEVGTNSVTEFIKKVLPKLELKKEDLRTTKFSIEHVIENDYRTDKEKDLGYQFEQKSNIEFDYDKDKINTFMSETLKMEQIPEYDIKFDIKDKENANADALKLAFEECEKKAKLIASASNLNLKKCQKTDFQPIE
ncbi:SIMPL domain-containing protein, partial [bacterium]|nr:SIMPL domain-containing protein [bacterium]